VLDLSTGRVAIGAEVVQQKHVLAIAHVPGRRRHVEPPVDPRTHADPYVSPGWWVLAGAILCPSYLEQLREDAWGREVPSPPVELLPLNAPVPDAAADSQNGHHARDVVSGDALQVVDDAAHLDALLP